MAAADDEGHDQRWDKNNEFNNRNPTPGVESHDDSGILNAVLVVENALLGRFLVGSRVREYASNSLLNTSGSYRRNLSIFLTSLNMDCHSIIVIRFRNSKHSSAREECQIK